MFAVLFEVCPKPERWDDYLGYAGLLRPELERIDGFVENERFASRRRPGWLLSLSIWRNEKALIRWRTHARHHEVQEKGRSEVFRDYHLRVGEIVADSGAGNALRQERLDETETGAAKLVGVTEAVLGEVPPRGDPAALAARLGMAERAGLVGWDVFDSITAPGKLALLESWRDVAAAGSAPPDTGGGARHRRIRVIRDYGMHERAEAPQYYPPVPGPAAG